MPNSGDLFDAHAHVITDDTAAYPPSPISGRLRPGVLDAPITAERLLAEMDAHGVGRAALVQRAHVYGYDNSYVVDAAARYPDRFVAICVVDSMAADAGERATHWLDRGAVGIRLTEPERGAGGAWLDGAAARNVWDAVARFQRTISVQLYTWNRSERLPDIPSIARGYGAVPVIVEHLSNFVETDEPPDHGADAALDALAATKNIYLKVTTINLARCLVNGVDAGEVLRRMTDRFGAHRLLWGSDIGQSPQTYAQMTAMARAAVSGTDRDALLTTTAAALFP